MLDEVVTVIGTPNIALTKYWGKRDEKLILPTNSSISLTFDENLATTSSVVFSKKLKEDRLFIDGKQLDLNEKEPKERFQIVDMMRSMAKTDAKVLVVSKNNFPASSGLASSASGLATLTYACSSALGLNLSKKDMTIMARQGSGSSCRSLLGGIVEWKKGERQDGSDSYAEQVVDEKYWPELIDVVAIVTREKKKVSSRSGMKQTVATSVLYKARLGYIEQANDRLRKAVRDRDFETLAEITMRDSNDMHAVMLDTYPPLTYMNDSSRVVLSMIHELNDTEGKTVGAYTFDAGPNAHVITLRKNVDRIAKMLGELEEVEQVLKVGQGGGPRVLKPKDALIGGDLAPI